MQNAIVYHCVRMISEAAASIPLLLYDGAEELEDHPLLTLLASPSPHQTGTDFLESFIGYLLVSGNSYVEAVALKPSPPNAKPSGPASKRHHSSPRTKSATQRDTAPSTAAINSNSHPS